jgi:hypothetical protein
MRSIEPGIHSSSCSGGSMDSGLALSGASRNDSGESASTMCNCTSENDGGGSNCVPDNPFIQDVRRQSPDTNLSTAGLFLRSSCVFRKNWTAISLTKGQ